MSNGISKDDPAAVLDRVIAEQGEDYSSLSRLIGRNPAYIQQFIKRGSPRALSESDRRLLASYLDIDEILLGAPDGSQARLIASANRGLVNVPRLNVGASAGPGALGDSEQPIAQFAFDARWLRGLSPAPQQLSIIQVEGDSMVPTLNHGDEIMVDASDAINRLRDGIYVLRRDNVILVKRLSRRVRGRTTLVNVISDNANYPLEADVPIEKLTVVGRVVWAGRRIS